MNNKFYLLILLIIAFVFSCKKETEEPIEMGYEYFPTEIGFYQIYEVDSVVWDDNNNSMYSFNYFVKLKIVDAFIDNTNNEAYRWRKSVKTDTTNWKFSNNYTLTKTSSSLESVIENNRFINLIFPVRAGGLWDYNAKNNNKAANSIYTDVAYSETIINNTFDECAKAQYEEEINLIQEFANYEIFAKNVGMIKRKHIHKETKINGVSGYNVEYNIIEYGNESN